LMHFSHSFILARRSRIWNSTNIGQFTVRTWLWGLMDRNGTGLQKLMWKLRCLTLLCEKRPTSRRTTRILSQAKLLTLCSTKSKLPIRRHIRPRRCRCVKIFRSCLLTVYIHIKLQVESGQVLRRSQGTLLPSSVNPGYRIHLTMCDARINLIKLRTLIFKRRV
jgi:hypothetical protein